MATPTAADTFPRFRRTDKGDAKLAAARSDIRALLVCRAAFSDGAQAGILKSLLWNVTESYGKWNLPYRSLGSLQPGAELRHEHVTERAKTVRALLAHPERVDEILDSVVACVVTPEEHTRLGQVHRTLESWERYRAAGVAVVDASTGEWLIPPTSP